MTADDVAKSLEVWTLQNLVNASIVLGLLAAGIAMVQGYFKALEKHLSLRVSIEVWRVSTVLAVDVCLVIAVLIGYLTLNPDIMSDIKVALPFYPVATILLAVALVLRLFHGGHDVASKNYLRSLYLMLAANLINMVGFTCVMEAPGKEYMERYTCPCWAYIETHLRSNADPHGIDLAQDTFTICLPILLLIGVWGVGSALRQLRGVKGE